MGWLPQFGIGKIIQTKRIEAQLSLLSTCPIVSQAIFSDNSESELGRGAVKEKVISHLSEFF